MLDFFKYFYYLLDYIFSIKPNVFLLCPQPKHYQFE